MDPPLRIGQLPCAAHEISRSICHDHVQYEAEWGHDPSLRLILPLEGDVSLRSTFASEGRTLTRSDACGSVDPDLGHAPSQGNGVEP